MPAQHTTREAWLLAARDALEPDFSAAGYQVAEARISVGFPKGTRGRSKAIGQCFGASADGLPAVFISPELVDVVAPQGVLSTLVHELVHATVGTKEGHKGEFTKAARALGLEGKLTATHAGEALSKRLNAIAGELGEYPHSALSATSGTKKQSTRMLKAECGQCGYIIRMSAKWADSGLPTCPCGEEFELA
jgi:hypothetical protein